MSMLFWGNGWNDTHVWSPVFPAGEVKFLLFLVPMLQCDVLPQFLVHVSLGL